MCVCVVKGLPSLRDRFVQYTVSVRVSFGGSGTLKIVIYVETTPRNRKIGWMIIAPSVGGGVNQRKIYVFLPYMYM